jgi:Zn-dependent protease
MKRFFEVLEIIKTEFQLKDAYLKEDTPTFIISSTTQFTEKTESLRNQLRQKGLDIILQKSNNDIYLQVVPLIKQPVLSKSFFKINLSVLLFIITIITVTISGYLSAQSHISLLKMLATYNNRPLGIADENLYLLELSAMYLISIMAIIGLHEVGHTIACRIHHIDASLPTFIPGIPGLTPGTFGAVIMQREPTLNRNQLFDIGLAGPLVGFIVSVIVSIIGYSWSIPVSRGEYLYIISKTGESGSVIPPALFLMLQSRIFPNPNSFTYFLHPVAIAGWMGTLITFLNIFPIGQLDGGHVSRAILGSKWHSRLSYIMIGVMILAGWWTMALLVVFLITTKHPGTLDNVSDLSKNRKIAGVLILIMIFAACFTISSDSLLLSLLSR